MNVVRRGPHIYTDAEVSMFICVKSRVVLSNDKINADYLDRLSGSKLSCCCSEQSKRGTLLHHYSSPGLCSDEAVYLMTGSQDIESSTATTGP